MTFTRQYIEQHSQQTPREDIIRVLADIANSRHSDLDTLSFRALPPGFSLFDAPTYTVDILYDDLKIGTYKYNVLEDAAVGKTARGIILSPLVIQWAEGGKHKQSGMDKTIIRHCIKTIADYAAQSNTAHDAVLLTTAYLTKQRDGKKFFEDMGWQVIEYDTKETGGMIPALHDPYAQVATRIAALSAAHRTSTEEADHVCFAYILI